jgi:hypothetical protein
MAVQQPVRTEERAYGGLPAAELPKVRLPALDSQLLAAASSIHLPALPVMPEWLSPTVMNFSFAHLRCRGSRGPGHRSRGRGHPGDLRAARPVNHKGRHRPHPYRAHHLQTKKETIGLHIACCVWSGGGRTAFIASGHASRPLRLAQASFRAHSREPCQLSMDARSAIGACEPAFAFGVPTRQDTEALLTACRTSILIHRAMSSSGLPPPPTNASAWS